MNLGTVGRTSCAALLGIALQAQLPPEIELDRQLLAAREARAEEDWLSVHLALVAASELSEEHDLELPPEYRFLRAEVSLFVEEHDVAIKHVTEYSGTCRAGRGALRRRAEPAEPCRAGEGRRGGAGQAAKGRGGEGQGPSRGRKETRRGRGGGSGPREGLRRSCR